MDLVVYTVAPVLILLIYFAFLRNRQDTREYFWFVCLALIAIAAWWCAFAARALFDLHGVALELSEQIPSAIAVIFFICIVLIMFDKSYKTRRHKTAVPTDQELLNEYSDAARIYTLYSRSDLAKDIKERKEAHQKITTIVNELSRRDPSLKQLVPLLNSEDTGVRVWTASWLMNNYEEQSLKTLKEIAATPEITSSNAAILARSWLEYFSERKGRKSEAG